MTTHPVLIDGKWIASTGTETFQAANPTTEELLPDRFPVSPWEEIERAIQVAAAAAKQMRGWPGTRFAAFLEKYAAHLETALPKDGRLAGIELPRTVNQLRQAAAAAREGTWATATIDTANNIRSMYGPIGPVVVFGPNNFPFAFNGISGGDFAAAIAAGNPVIAKGHSSHPNTTRVFAE